MRPILNRPHPRTISRARACVSVFMADTQVLRSIAAPRVWAVQGPIGQGLDRGHQARGAMHRIGGGHGGDWRRAHSARTSQIYAKILDRPLGGQRRALWGAAGARTPGARQRGLAGAAGGHSGRLRLLRAAQGTDSPPEHADRGSHTTRTWAGRCRTGHDQPGCHRQCDPGPGH